MASGTLHLPEDENMIDVSSDIPAEPQPIEVDTDQTEDRTGEQKFQAAAEPLMSGRFVWAIKSFTEQKLYSDSFSVGGFNWRILIFPHGRGHGCLSMFLDVADADILPEGWVIFAKFSLCVVNQHEKKFSIRKDAQHQFRATECDWGFSNFMSLRDLYDLNKGYLVNGFVVEAEVTVFEVADHIRYNSKKETGFVGLRNQGATCYINSLLQTLYHIPYFRKAVYHMPTDENDSPTRSLPLALQNLFYRLQCCESSVATNELTQSFGWNSSDSLMQHDVQELNRVLCEKLESKMKGTVVNGTIQKLFEGHHINYIECINVGHKSSRKESFYDLQLDVKGCKDVYASFDKYVEEEKLEGDNKYHAEQHGLQDAKKGVLFIDFPPVLQLQLKRFEYDFLRDIMVKVNDRYEFPMHLDLDRDGGKYLSSEADRSVRNYYTLHSVLVHSGGVHSGHYYAFIRPNLSDQWFKFDDDRVTQEDAKRVLEEQYGGAEENSPFKSFKNHNAYMLVYIRESDREDIFCNVEEKDIAQHLKEKLKKEEDEREHRRKEKAEAHLYMTIKVSRDKDLHDLIGKYVIFDLVDHDKVFSFRVQKNMPFSNFKLEVAKVFGIPEQYQRFWLWAIRKNNTNRPHRPISPDEEMKSVGLFGEHIIGNIHDNELRIFLEVELGQDMHHVPPPEKTKEDLLLFFKLYDPEKEELRYAGRLFVKDFKRPVDIRIELNRMAGFPSNEEIEFYEEVNFQPTIVCMHIDGHRTFRSLEIQDGDIICYQKCSSVNSSEVFRYPTIPGFLQYVQNKKVVHFRSLEKPKEDNFYLELSKVSSYDETVTSVARQLDVDDPTKIRLTGHNCYSQLPRPQPIRYREFSHLIEIVHHHQSADVIYYEVLDIPLPLMENLKSLKVFYHHATTDEVAEHTVRLPNNSTVGDVIADLKAKVELSNPNADLRLLEISCHKICKVLHASERIESIYDQECILRAEEVPDEEKNIGPADRLVCVCHFTKVAPSQTNVLHFGSPFFLLIHDGETLAQVKIRIKEKLRVQDIAMWKFAILRFGRPDYLQDDDVLSVHFQNTCEYWEKYLGLEHLDMAPKRTFAAENNRQNFKKSVMIYN